MPADQLRLLDSVAQLGAQLLQPDPCSVLHRRLWTSFPITQVRREAAKASNRLSSSKSAEESRFVFSKLLINALIQAEGAVRA